MTERGIDVIVVRTGEPEVIGESVLLRNPCGNCSHDWVAHIHEGDVHPFDLPENEWIKNSWVARYDQVAEEYKHEYPYMNRPKCSVKVDESNRRTGGCSCGTGWIAKYQIVGRHHRSPQDRR